MDNPSGSSPLKDAQELPDWANWPLRSDGKLDAERLMPTTFRVCSKEYCRSRQDLTKCLPTLVPPKRDKYETKQVPIITNLTLLELFDLSGEEIIEFRNFVLETLGEFDRIYSSERLMSDHAAIRRSMRELRKTAYEIQTKKSKEESTAFLNKRANLAILGYFTRRDPRNQNPPLSPPLLSRHFKEFLLGNKGAARVSIYNWRHKQWGESVNKNLFSKSDEMENSNGFFKPNLEKSHVMPKLESYGKLHSEDVEKCGDDPESSPSISPSTPTKISSVSDPKKMKIETDFNIIPNGRDEINFYCAVKANKVNPAGFGLPKGFIKYGNKMVHYSRSDLVEKAGIKRKRSKNSDDSKSETKNRETKQTRKRMSAEESIEMSHSSPPSKDNVKEEHAGVKESIDFEVVMDDIEEDDTAIMTEIDVGGVQSPGFTTESSSQTEGAAKEDRVMDAEMVAHLGRLEAAHSEDMTIIQKLRVENALAVKNLSKYYNKCVALMMDRNNIKCTLNAMDKERKSERSVNNNLKKEMKQLAQQNGMLIDEVNALKRELAMRDEFHEPNREVGRYEEYCG